MNSARTLPDGLILSAGFSSRMKSFKPLINWQGEPLLLQIIKKMLPVCGTVVIVTGFRGDEVEETVKKLLDAELHERIRFIHNPAYAEGMHGSLKTGFRSLHQSEWVLFHFVDQPGLSNSFYTEFTEQIDPAYNWIQPRCQERNAHPLLIHNSLFPLIYEPNEYTSLRDISRLLVVKKKLWDCNYPGVLLDIDTEADWNNFLNQWDEGTV